MTFVQSIQSAVLGMLVALSGCQRAPFAHLSTTTKPISSNLLGTYELTKQTVTSDGLIFLNGKPSSVELKSDGTCVLTNYPSGAGGNLGQLVSGKGEWELDQVGSIQFGLKDVRPVWGIRFKGYAFNIAPLGLTGAKAPFGGLVTYGDPDTGAVAFFTKANPATR